MEDVDELPDELNKEDRCCICVICRQLFGCCCFGVETTTDERFLLEDGVTSRPAIVEETATEETTQLGEG